MAYADDQNPSGLNDFGALTAEIASCYWLLWSNSNSELRQIDHDDVLKGLLPSDAISTDADTTMTSADRGKFVTNAAFSADRTYTLPDPLTMTSGLLMFLCHTDSYSLTITPASGDWIGHYAVDRSLTLSSKGQTLLLKSYGGGGWQIVAGNYRAFGTASSSATVAAGGFAQVTVTVNGIVSGDAVGASISPANNASDLLVSACATATDTVVVNLFNPTGSDVTLSSNTVTAWLAS